MIILTVSPIKAKPGRFEGRIGDLVVVASSREPFFPVARLLLAEGVDPATPFVMRHAGSDTDALKSTIGAAAKLTVSETDRRGPRIISWMPFPSAAYGC